ncbi:Clan CA, family C19, ubiquitin hydrolase-like cysteine peptidase, partial [Reticulomyxa filosa]
MNAAFLNALKKRKEETDQYTTVGVGQGSEYDTGGVPSISDPSVPLPVRNARVPLPPWRQLNFFTGHISDKSETGFTGIQNQGATCYLNSLLQALFMTPELRQAVYEFAYNPELHPIEKSCIPLQLQRLFARLQISIKGAVSTTDLTTSFGWTDRQVYVQHDVLELADVLFDFVENQAFGFRLAEVVSVYHRMNVLNSSHGIGLDIEKAISFDDAMKRYITPEILTDGNKVTCDICNEKTTTKKGYRFDSFPYILKVYFRRWTFNMATLTRVKIDKEIPFPLEFDANQYIGSDGYGEVSEADKPDAQKDTLLQLFLSKSLHILLFFFLFIMPIIRGEM